MQLAEASANNLMLDKLYQKFGAAAFVYQPTADGVPTLWVSRGQLRDVLRVIKPDYPMLYDLFGIDERLRTNREDQPEADFSVVYHLLSFSSNEDFRLKVAVNEGDMNVPTIVSIWPAANWYERETWDMFWY